MDLQNRKKIKLSIVKFENISLSKMLILTTLLPLIIFSQSCQTLAGRTTGLLSLSESLGLFTSKRVSNVPLTKMQVRHYDPKNESQWTRDERGIRFRRLSNDIDDSSKTVRILSIDGGGIRGIISLRIIEHIENRMGKKAAEIFDIISGTSTGGIIALGLNVPSSRGSTIPRYAASDLFKLYESRGKGIFAKSFQQKIIPDFLWGLFRPKYSVNSLEKILNEYFGESYLSHSISTTLLPTYELERGQVVVFNSQNAKDFNEGESDFLMKDCARATSAAPTYFPPAKVKNLSTSIPREFILIDGGVGANDPSAIAYAQAKHLFPEADNFLIVSLGTGNNPIGQASFDSLENAGIIKWAPFLPGLIVNAANSAIEHQFFVEENYFRFQPRLDRDLLRLDSTSNDIIRKLVSHADKLLSERYKDFDLLFENLELNRPYVSNGKILTPGEDLVLSPYKRSRIVL